MTWKFVSVWCTTCNSDQVFMISRKMVNQQARPRPKPLRQWNNCYDQIDGSKFGKWPHNEFSQRQLCIKLSTINYIFERFARIGFQRYLKKTTKTNACRYPSRFWIVLVTTKLLRVHNSMIRYMSKLFYYLQQT